MIECYFFFRSVDEPDTVWGLEKYDSKSALYDVHIKSTEFETFEEALKKEGLPSAPLALDNYSASHGFLQRPNATKSPKGTFVWVAELTCKDSKARDTVLELSQPLAKYVEDSEPKTLSYLFLKSLDDEAKLTVFEQYENKAALTDIHHHSDAFLSFGKKLKDSGLVVGKATTGLTTLGAGFSAK